VIFGIAKEGAKKVPTRTSGAKALDHKEWIYAAVNRCATQNQSFFGIAEVMP
jgi:hypothetical protein